jgi:hypothetical protein
VDIPDDWGDNLQLRLWNWRSEMQKNSVDLTNITIMIIIIMIMVIVIMMTIIFAAEWEETCHAVNSFILCFKEPTKPALQDFANDAIYWFGPWRNLEHMCCLCASLCLMVLSARLRSAKQTQSGCGGWGDTRR